MFRRRWADAWGGAVGVFTIAGGLLLGTGAMASPAHAESMRASQWHLDAMHADEMWKSSKGDGVTVAVIDTGVDADHPDLQGRVASGRDFSTMSGGADTDADGHGTTMAAIIAGTGRGLGGEGGYGLAPAAKVLPLRVGADSEANFQGKAAEDARLRISKAIRYAADSDAQVINISQGLEEGGEDLTSAVDYALAKGKLIFAAAGNTGNLDDPVEYPAAIPGVVAVAALDKEGRPTEESQHGPEVDLSAPGEDIVSGCAGSRTGYCKSHGTSDATALASASAALIWSVHPDWTANQVLRVMINTAGAPNNGAKRNDYVGYGAVRPRIALTDPGDPGPADVSPLPEVVAAQEKEAGGSAESSDGSSAEPAPREESPSAAAAQGEDGSSGSNTVLWVVSGAAGAAAVALVSFILVRNRRRREPAAWGSPPSSWQ